MRSVFIEYNERIDTQIYDTQSVPFICNINILKSKASA